MATVTQLRDVHRKKEQLTVFDLINLPGPLPEFDLRLKLPQLSGNIGSDAKHILETANWCIKEDHRRANALEEMPLDNWAQKCNNWNLVDYLPDALRGSWEPNYFHTDPSRASATVMREVRHRLYGEVLRFFKQHHAEMAWIILGHEDWWFKIAENWNEFEFKPAQAVAAFLSEMNVEKVPGHLVVSVHPIFNPVKQRFQLEFRGIVTGAKHELLKAALGRNLEVSADRWSRGKHC